MAETAPPTQNEILEQQAAEIARLKVQVNKLNEIINNPADQPVTTESGVMPSMRGLQEEIRQRNGNRIDAVMWSGEDLARYSGGAEVMFRSINLRPIQLDPLLSGSYFKLASTSGQPIVLEIAVDTAKWTVTFPANSNTGSVTAADITEPASFGPGSMMTMRMTSPAWTSAGMAVAIVGLLDFVPPGGNADA